MVSECACVTKKISIFTALMPSTKHDIIRQLEKEILPLQGYKPPTPGGQFSLGMRPVEEAFPNGVFPTGAMHEFLAANQEEAAARSGFTAAVVGKLMQDCGVCVWIGRKMEVFPPALAQYGIGPERVIFITPSSEAQVIWAMEEALKCEGLAAVIGHVRDIDLTTSRRLQLAVEQSRVTGFILHEPSRQVALVAAVARWRIKPLPSALEDGLPGVGFPRWQVELLKVRNGRPGKWVVEWSARGFHVVSQPVLTETKEQKRKVV